MAKVAADTEAKEAGRQVSRRQFLGLGGAAAAVGTVSLALGARLLEPTRVEAATEGAVKYVMTIDLERCMGCRACMEACKVENNTPEAAFWMYVFRFEEGRYPDVRVSYLPRPCMHCGNAPCVKVCPVGARYKRLDGLTATDWDRCIGCRYCEVACPYGVNYFNWKDPRKRQYLDWQAAAPQLVKYTEGAIPPYRNPDLEKAYGSDKRRTAAGRHRKGVIGKCTFCVHRLEKGLLPACVANCPAKVFHFGNINDPNSEVHKALHSKRFFRLAEEAGTQPSVYYLGAPPPAPEIRQIDAITRRV